MCSNLFIYFIKKQRIERLASPATMSWPVQQRRGPILVASFGVVLVVLPAPLGVMELSATLGVVVVGPALG